MNKWCNFLLFSIGPLDRGCQELIIPACKNLGVSNYTLIGEDLQKDWYFHSYRKRFTPSSAEKEFPPEIKAALKKYPKCQENLKKLFCGEYFPPCFPDEEQGFYSICKSVCDDIARDCPEFFRYFIWTQNKREKAQRKYVTVNSITGFSSPAVQFVYVARIIF